MGRVVVAAVGYGRLRIGALRGGVLVQAHRAVGDAIARAGLTSAKWRDARCLA